MNYGYVEEMEEGSKDIVNLANNLESETGSVGNRIAEAFQEAIDSVKELAETIDNMSEPVETIAENLELVAQVDFGGLSNDLSEISDILTDVLEKLCETDWVGIAGLVMQAFSQGFDIFSWLYNPVDVKNNGGTLPSKVFDSASYADELTEAATGSGMLSVGLEKLRSALDRVKISKIAETAAQWAQTAAVTAWNGICGVASAVTTAFGAAVNFLTSPITLVVLGIAALIAIVVLLVKNWDTVKAALIAGWEAVKQAFSVAAEWFNTNVIQPLVGFFTGLWDQICVIVTNVTTFISTKFQEFTLWIQTAIANVQAVFMGIDAFLQGVFAVDWTTQFGAFGEVQSKIICFRKCCKGAMLPKTDDPRRLGVCLKKD